MTAMTRQLRPSLRAMLLAILLGAAIFGQGGASPLHQTILAVGVALAAGLTILSRAVDKVHAERVLLYKILLGILTLAAVSGVLQAPYRWAALLTMAGWVMFIGMLEWSGRATLQQRDQCLGLVLICSSFVSLGTWIEALMGAERPALTFLNPNHLGLWLVMICLATFHLHQQFPALRAFWWVSLAGIPATESRGALVALAIGGLIYVWLSRGAGLPHRQKRLLAIAVLMFISIGSAVFLLRLREEDPFRWQRLQIWQSGIQASLEAPLTGMGAGQFAVEADRFKFADKEGPLRFDRRFSNTHSDILRVAIEWGWPVFILLGIWLVLFTYAQSRLYQSSGGVSTLAALGAFLVASGLDNPSQRPAIMLLAAFLLSRFCFQPARDRQTRVLPIFKLCVVSLAVLLICSFELKSFRLWADVQLAPASESANEKPGLKTLYQSSGYAPASRQQLRIAMQNPNWDMEAFAYFRGEALHWTRFQPNNPESWQALARVERVGCIAGLQDAHTCARAHKNYQTAVELDPYNVSLGVEFVQFLLRVGETTKALREVDRLVRLEPEAAALWLLRAQVHLQLNPNDLQSANQDFKRALEFEAKHQSAYLANEGNRSLLILDPELKTAFRRQFEGLNP